ncbi:MAG: phosphotransferase [Chloroflexi bacterium]|nr:phosphotransferase [Chloroflexota bacterium]
MSAEQGRGGAGAPADSPHPHASPCPERIPQETFSPYWRERVREFCGLARLTKFDDPVAAALAALLQEKGREIGALVDHAERLAEVLQTRDLPFVVCHADIHAGNVHITPVGDLYVVDWDTMILAPASAI